MASVASDSASERERLARRYVWWRPAEDALARLPTLLCQIMATGTASDYVSARRIWGEQAFRGALTHAPPGAMDERSWIFWHRLFGMSARPMPLRRFDDAAS